MQLPVTSVTIAFEPSEELFDGIVSAGATTFIVLGKNLCGQTLSFDEQQEDLAKTVLATRTRHAQQCPLSSVSITFNPGSDLFELSLIHI